MQEDERIGATNVAAAVRAIKHQGLFMMFDRDNTHYLATRQFFLKLRTRDAWRIQCRLEIEHRGRWYQKFEGHFYESDRKPEIEKFIEIYEGWLQRASVDIAPIGLTLEKFGARLFAGDGGYTAIDSELFGNDRHRSGGNDDTPGGEPRYHRRYASHRHHQRRGNTAERFPREYMGSSGASSRNYAGADRIKQEEWQHVE